MKVTKEMPKSGQFVAIWSVKSGEVFSATLDWVGFILRSYDGINDEWDCEHGYEESFFKSVSAQFFVKGE